VEQPLAHDPVGEDIQGQLLFAIEIGRPRHAEVARSNGVYDVLGRLGNFADYTGQVPVFPLFSQITPQIDLKFGLAGFGHDLLLFQLSLVDLNRKNVKIAQKFRPKLHTRQG
jgi:hypothetical protein